MDGRFRAYRCQTGAHMDHQQDYVLRTVEERRVRLVRLWFTDVLGQIKSVAISPIELDAGCRTIMQGVPSGPLPPPELTL